MIIDTPALCRRPWLPLAAACLVLFGSLACSFTGIIAPATATITPTLRAASSTPTPSPTATATRTPTAVPPTREPTAGELVFLAMREEVLSEAPKYTIRMEMPHLSSGGEAAPLFNNAVARLAQEEKDRFLQDVAANESWRQENMPQVASDLNIIHRVRYNRRGLASVQFSIGVYIAGAAHPNAYTHTINLDAASLPAILSLNDLFIPQSDYLARLADFSTRELESREALAFPEGAAPVPENYRNWLLDLQGLVFVFDPYQVAPYALGPQEVLVPYRYLETIINNEGPLGKVLE